MKPTDTSTAKPHGAPDPRPILELATGYWASAAFLAANDLGVFGALAEGPRNATQVAEALGTDARLMEPLLNACCGLGILAKEADAFALTPASGAYLVPGRPGYLGGAIRWGQTQYATWGRLAETVRTGCPAQAPEMHLGADPERTRAFVRGMHERAAGMARGVIGFLDLAGCKTLLDVGGGPGTFAAMLAAKYPGLQATVLDLPGIVEVAREMLTESGQAERVTFTTGDATAGEYGEAQYDAVLFSGVLHQMAPPTIQRMLAGAYRALRPDGRVYVSDMMLDASKTQPVFSALFSLQMALTSHEGLVFSADECVAWLEAAGFQEAAARRLPEPLPYTLVSARR